MGLLTIQEKMAVQSTGQDIKELPKLKTVPYGWYLHRDGKRITYQQADSLFIPFHQARGLEFLCMAREYTLDSIEAMVYLRAVGRETIPEPEAEVTHVVTAPKAKRNKRKKKGVNK